MFYLFLSLYFILAETSNKFTIKLDSMQKEEKIRIKLKYKSGSNSYYKDYEKFSHNNGINHFYSCFLGNNDCFNVRSIS